MLWLGYASCDLLGFLFCAAELNRVKRGCWSGYLSDSGRSRAPSCLSVYEHYPTTNTRFYTAYSFLTCRQTRQMAECSLVNMHQADCTFDTFQHIDNAFTLLLDTIFFSIFPSADLVNMLIMRVTWTIEADVQIRPVSRGQMCRCKRSCLCVHNEYLHMD